MVCWQKYFLNAPSHYTNNVMLEWRGIGVASAPYLLDECCRTYKTQTVAQFLNYLSCYSAKLMQNCTWWMIKQIRKATKEAQSKKRKVKKRSGRPREWKYQMHGSLQSLRLQGSRCDAFCSLSPFPPCLPSIHSVLFISPVLPSFSSSFFFFLPRH